MDKLELSRRRFLGKKYEPDYRCGFNEFILNCFLEYHPSSYGKYLQKRIMMEIEKFGVLDVPDKKNNGDCKLYFYPEGIYDCTLVNKECYFRFHHPDLLKYALSMYYEIKCSYLGKNGCYTLRNIRPYQNIDGGYIICFIDCENNFTPEFYLIDFDVIAENFTMSHMNGVSSEHEDGKFLNVGVTIRKGSANHYVLKYYNKLEGTKLEDLISYFDKTRSEMEIKFYQNEEYQSEVAEYRERHYKYVDNYVAEYRRLGRPL
jgi:hypothetical protein